MNWSEIRQEINKGYAPELLQLKIILNASED